jgi:hypothetical protein
LKPCCRRGSDGGKAGGHRGASRHRRRTLGEQKSQIDLLSEKLARIDFTMQEAQNTLQTLRTERELGAAGGKYQVAAHANREG